MKQRVEFNLNKIILIMLVIFMILPFSINIIGISLAKTFTILLVLVFIFIFYKNKEELLNILKNKFIILNIIFAFTIALSIIFNFRMMKFNDLFEIVKYFIFAMIAMLTIKICKNKENYLFLLKTISIVLILISIFGIVQYFNPFSINEMYIQSYAPTQYESLVNDYPSPRIVGTKSNPAVYGVLMSIGVYFNLLYFRGTNSKKGKILAIASIVLCVINLLMTLTRTIQVAFMISVILYIFFNVCIEKGMKRALIAMLLSVLIISIILCLLPKSLTWRLVQILDMSNATSWLYRIAKWQECGAIIKQNLMVGIGPIKNYSDTIGYVDSELVQTVLQYGILGTIAYIIMLLSPFYEYLKDKNKKNILRFYPALLAIIIINNISNTSLILFDTSIGIYILVGLLFIGGKENEEKYNI